MDNSPAHKLCMWTAFRFVSYPQKTDHFSLSFLFFLKKQHTMSWQDRFILALATAFRNEQQQTGCITGLLLTQQAGNAPHLWGRKKMVHDHKKSFMKIFNETARYHHRYQVFRDFVTMAGISMHNSIMKNEVLEQEYLDVVKRYERPDVERFPQLLAELVMGLDADPGDFLGSVFMQLELGSDNLGQFFTPYSISKMMSMVTIGNNLEKSLSVKPFITLSEPACGAGSTVIAFAETMKEMKFNPQKQLWVNCVDIDPVAAMMCYLQLSLLHIPGEVVTGNSLTLQYSRVMRTPAHYLGNWDYKLSKQYTEPVQNHHEPVSMPVKQVNLKPLGEQISLFSLESFACETLTP